MSYFLLPKTLCEELESIMSKFWWQKPHNKKGLICEDGGLEFHNLVKFNIALLAKQGWGLWHAYSKQNATETQIFEVQDLGLTVPMYGKVPRRQGNSWKRAQDGMLARGEAYPFGTINGFKDLRDTK
ncbi:Ribonuclease H-like superfamily protein [Gossypium australe]|uniref:Ribonuclease H-like superfamily protein n=1 Tax=Gossypium australe TaxID=47621 RepID=A0A5B6U569_9ROSI|nr:Ribonuclease H-like superfamily protein [Gossypium australe]